MALTEIKQRPKWRRCEERQRRGNPFVVRDSGDYKLRPCVAPFGAAFRALIFLREKFMLRASQYKPHMSKVSAILI